MESGVPYDTRQNELYEIRFAIRDEVRLIVDYQQRHVPQDLPLCVFGSDTPYPADQVSEDGGVLFYHEEERVPTWLYPELACHRTLEVPTVDSIGHRL